MMIVDTEVLLKDEIVDLINSHQESTHIINRIVRHDVENTLSELEFIINHSQIKDKDCAQGFIGIVNKQIQVLRESIDLLSTSNKTEFSFAKIIIPVIVNCGLIDNVEFDIDSCNHIIGNPKLFVAIFKNIAENAKEAYLKKYGKLQGFELKIITKLNTINFIDNSGGFDISKIQEGNSSKETSKEKHGIFLHTMMTKAYHLGIEFKIQREGRGTRITIGFLQ